MEWRDLLYFSAGERRALTLLLILITIAFILLIWTDEEETSSGQSQSIISLHNPYSTDSLAAVKSLTTIHPEKQKTITSPKVQKQVFSPQPRNFSPKKNNPNFVRAEKYPIGTIVEINTADTTILKKIPGIGSVYSRRIIRYRNLLGGFYCISQLSEVYGIDEEKYQSLVPWFSADTSRINRLQVNYIPMDSLRKHPYLNNRQIYALNRLRQRKGSIEGWQSLSLLEEFTPADRERLQPYLVFD